MNVKLKLILSALLLAVFAKAQQPPPLPQRPPSKEEHLKRVSDELKNELELTAVQHQKVTAAYKQFFEGIEAAQRKMMPPPPPPLPIPLRKEEMDQLVKERDSTLQKVLTATQFKKFEEGQERMFPKPPAAARP